MTKIRNGFILLMLLVVAGVGYTVLGGSPVQLPMKERASAPAPVPTDKDGSRRVKLTVIVDGDAKNFSPDRINVWYAVDGVKYPSHGAFQTKRYWYRVLEVKIGTALSLTAQNYVKTQRIDVSIFYEAKSPRVIDNGTCVGLCVARAKGVVR